MPSHTELERAKRRLDISRPIDSFPSGSIQKQREKIKRKTLNFRANPRSRPSAPIISSPATPAVSPQSTSPTRQTGIFAQARAIAEEKKKRERGLLNIK